jgi:hypothetical protein
MLTERTRGIAVSNVVTVSPVPCRRQGTGVATIAPVVGPGALSQVERVLDWPTRKAGPRMVGHEHRRGGSVAETVKKGARITGADRAKLAGELTKKYANGASIRALAEETGRSYGFVHRILTENDVSLRSRGGATRGKAKQR